MVELVVEDGQPVGVRRRDVVLAPDEPWERGGGRGGIEDPRFTWVETLGMYVIMARTGLRGPWASAMCTVVRLTNDQILENATGVGAPPQTWPRPELAIDLLHKTVYGYVTGAVADALAARDGLGPGQRHAALRPGRRSDVGPLPHRS